ncbi:DegT/DnrJ/EryC1/StrS family aminotransferase [Azospirillum rugosum]|uniref:dTDP-4-amino-4,6-dideoxygalactose transaminase n=1 Tax=Azospirillum rugosum TaxID=416170 RepID=A0ABS4SGU1_9PROT|nr:DegT/DnrJ/EryC1/StrS aminotransferase family protein [Azospirillum rugosum]MBP2291278.1 dTDP-4-amino-4,6-dideoxygalactose transaminase [Azospirillum rugosum]MDQ0525066.1 dTDP-4-amino-4,6-dideoxygalactose transaminase [Azospirillum rugosum]
MLLVAEPTLGEEEKAALAAVIDSGWITMGDRVAAFEKAFAAAHGVADAVAVGSCTAGLHLVLESLGIGPGDEVLVPAMTFVATANAVLHAGATPVFVDIEALDRPLMAPDDAKDKLTARTRAVILVDYAGTLPDPDLWRAFAAAHGLRLIEDAAHAAGAEGAGAIGDAGVFSFYGNKNMTTAEGGMVFARDPAVLERIRRLRGHGMTSSTRQRLSGHAQGYDVTMLGYNHRMDELRAAVGLVQLAKLPAWNAKRRALTEAYRQRLRRACPDVLVPFADNQPSSNHILPVLLPEGADRETVMDALRADGIQTSVHYAPVHLFTLYRERCPDVALPLTEEFARRELTLPLHPKMEDAQVDTVVQALADALSRADVRGVAELEGSE